MMKVLVTGASGFIGNRVALAFQNKGYDVIGWNRTGAANVFLTEKVNMLSKSEIVKHLGLIQPNIIIHCAGSADVSKSVSNPEIDYEGNVTLTHNMLFALHTCGFKNTRFVYLSSAGVYGNPISLPITEDMPLNPLSPYAVHKVMCEELCKYFVRNYGMNVKVARIFSAYGEGLKKQLFWDMYQKLKNTHYLDLFGTGKESRDYIHIDDVVQSLHLLATKDTEHMIFNIANGTEVTIQDAAGLFAAAAGVEKSRIHFNGIVREGDPLNWKADIGRISALGYKNTVDMKSGIYQYVNWCCQSNGEGN